MRTILKLALALAAIAFACVAWIYLTLPDVRQLRTANPETTAFMELRAREALAREKTPRRVQRWVPYSRFSPSLVRAVLLTEDARFWSHDGLDYQEIRASMEINVERREFARGASTITQQLAKNLYLSPSKNPIRKVRELLIARRLESELSKQRIFELYLNVIEWGDGIYGAEAAARTYFRKPASQLSASESALLAASIANPRLLNPARPTARLRRRQQMVMRRMGAVEPPPVIIAAPTLPPPAAATDSAEPIPAVPPVEGLPASLPGEAVPPPKKPGSGDTGGPS